MAETPRFRPADPLGLQRVVRKPGEAGPVPLPQQAEKLDPSLPIAQDELLIEVESLSLDSASFLQISEACSGDAFKIERHLLDLARVRGKLHGVGGLLVGRVTAVGPKSPVSERSAKVGERVATLVSLSLTPLEIRKIKAIHPKLGRIDVEGHAIVFASGVFTKLPPDLPEADALAVLGAAGAPVQTAKLVQPKDTILVIGGGGNAGVLSLYEAKKKEGTRTIAVDRSAEAIERLARLSFVDEVVQADAQDTVAVMEKIWNLTKGRMADVVINVANSPGTEMACVLSCRPKGVIYFFNLATDFARVALGASGVGADVDLRIGNGYIDGHAELALNILRESEELQKFFSARSSG